MKLADSFFFISFFSSSSSPSLSLSPLTFFFLSLFFSFFVLFCFFSPRFSSLSVLLFLSSLHVSPLSLFFFFFFLIQNVGSEINFQYNNMNVLLSRVRQPKKCTKTGKLFHFCFSLTSNKH